MQTQEYVIIYDRDLKKVAHLENAFKITYDMPMNGVSMAKFALPSIDEKNRYCQGGYFAEIFDGDRRIDLFKIMQPRKNWSAKSDTQTYLCEHVINTMFDDVLFGLHGNIGGVNGTSDAIQYVLDHQETNHWVLGACEFSRDFVYEFENINLRKALYSIPREFGDVYLWTTNTTTYPWTLNLVTLNDKAEARIYYKANMIELTREIDYTKLFNRVYALGAGEGVNQLNIESVEPSGNKYVEDLESIEEYGLKQYILADRRYTNSDNLYAAAQNFLSDHKDPPVTYKIKAADISSVTGKSWDYFMPGTMVLVKNYDMRTPVKVRVKNVSKNDVSGKPWDVSLELGNFVGSITSSNLKTMGQVKVEQTVSQGATNVYSDSIAENADISNPAKIHFYIDGDVINVNKCLLRLRAAAYRAFTRTTKSGGSSSPTSDSGGGATQTSGDGAWTTTPSSFLGAEFMAEAGDPPHSHAMISVNHYHTVDIPSHRHDVSIPSHSHGLSFGIYEGTTASSLTIKVDNNTLVESGTSYDELDIVPHLNKNPDGKIARGWHTVEIAPNQNSRIEANIYVQAYVQSRGNYVK